MSFFDQPKNAGLAMIVVAIVEVIAAIINIVAAATADDGIDFSGIIVAIGLIITAVIYFKYGSQVRSGAISAKIDILASFVNVVGVISIVNGVFQIIAGVAGGAGLIGNGVINIIIGLIICFCGKKINDGKETTLDKIIWIILLVIFIIELLLNIVALIGFPIGTILGICGIIIYIFMLTLLFDGEVKKEMGM